MKILGWILYGLYFLGSLLLGLLLLLAFVYVAVQFGLGAGPTHN